MEFDPEDQEIIRLLTKIKDAEGEYPEHMLVARRRSYLKRMGEVEMGIGADMGVKNVLKDAKPPHISPVTSTLLETALVVAIIAEASTVAYFYRDRLADFFRRAVMDPRAQEVTPSTVVPTSLEIQAILPSATIWSAPTPMGIAVTPTGTPVPGIIPGVVDNGINTATTGEVNVLNATPDPGLNNSSGNNGNHYGQTPKPERTKENGNNPPPKEEDGKPPQDNDDKPPKENEDQPSQEDKPPKDNNDKPPKGK